MFGALPAEVFDPVPVLDLRRAIVEGMPGLRPTWKETRPTSC